MSWFTRIGNANANANAEGNGMDSSHLSASTCQTDMMSLSDKLAEESEMNIKRIGLDLAKQVFQLHGVDSHEQLVLRTKLKREQLITP